MGLIRKTLFVGTMGAVAPNSKKQRVAQQTLAAVQGKSAREVARAGTRREAIAPTRPEALERARQERLQARRDDREQVRLDMASYKARLPKARRGVWLMTAREIRKYKGHEAVLAWLDAKEADGWSRG